MYGFGIPPIAGFAFPRDWPVGFQPRSSHLWFIECNDSPMLEQMNVAYRSLESAVNKTEFALHLHHHWKREHNRSLDSRALLSRQNKTAQSDLEKSHFGFLSARLTLAVTFNPLFKSTRQMQALLAVFLKKDVENSFVRTDLQSQMLRDPDQPQLKPYHLDVFRLNVNVCTLLLEKAFELLGHSDFEDCMKVENQIPCSLNELLGPRTVISDLPLVKNEGSTLYGMLTWFKELLCGKTQFSWGGVKERYWGSFEATSLAFRQAGWKIERVDPSGEARENGEKVYYVLTPPVEDKAR